MRDLWVIAQLDYSVATDRREVGVTVLGLTRLEMKTAVMTAIRSRFSDADDGQEVMLFRR